MCIYIYIYLHTHIYTYIYIDTHTHTSHTVSIVPSGRATRGRNDTRARMAENVAQSTHALIHTST